MEKIQFDSEFKGFLGKFRFGLLIISVIFFVIGGQMNMPLFTFFGIVCLILFVWGMIIYNTHPKIKEKNSNKKKEKWFSWGVLLFLSLISGGILGIIYLIIKLGQRKK